MQRREEENPIKKTSLSVPFKLKFVVKLRDFNNTSLLLLFCNMDLRGANTPAAAIASWFSSVHVVGKNMTEEEEQGRRKKRRTEKGEGEEERGRREDRCE